MLKIPCSYVAGLVGMNRFKTKLQTVCQLITRYNPEVLEHYLTPSETNRLQNKRFYADSRKAALVKQCLRGEDVVIPLRYKNQVAGILREKKHKFLNSHEFVTKKFANYELYGQTDGTYKNKVLEFKTRMRYYLLPQHDMIQLGCYMVIKQSDGVLVQDLHGKLKERHWSLKEMETYMKPHLAKLEEVVEEVYRIFKGEVTEEERKYIRYSLLC